MQQTSLAILIQRGLALHRQAKFDEAQKFYEQVLAQQANHFDALYLLGTLSAQRQQFTRADALLSKALQINPHHAGCNSNRGNVLKALKRLDEALYSYDEAIRLQPDFAQVYANRGNVLQELNRFDDALRSYDQAISLQAGDAECYSNRGIALQKLQRLDDAVLSYDQAIAANSAYAPAYFHRANVLHELNRSVEALTSYDQAIKLKPEYAPAYYNRGNLLHQLQRFDQALSSYDEAIRYQPDYADAYANRGIVLLELNRLDEALLNFELALTLHPDAAQFHFNRGSALLRLKRFSEALSSFENAICLQTDCADFYCNRGQALQELLRFEDAVLSYDQAISIKSDYASAYYNRGLALRELQRLDEAIMSYQRAIQISPDFAEAHWNLALCHLLAGNFKDGWQGFEWRWRDALAFKFQEQRNFSQPLWLGEASLEDKTILLYAEQGLGDTLQFSRYVEGVVQCGAKVILEVQRPLVSLLGHLDGISQIVARGDALPAFDYQCPLCSLPLAFKTELHTIPQVSQQITSDSDHVEKWRSLIGQSGKPRIGIVWRGNPMHKNDDKRRISLAQLIPYLSSQFDYFSLQKELGETDRALLADCGRIKHFGEKLEDFADTAALCTLMDLVISVDTSVAHLAGTLGRPTWILLPYSPDWRWLLERDDSPWYSSVKLYRQETTGDWRSVLEKARCDLQQLLSDRGNVIF